MCLVCLCGELHTYFTARRCCGSSFVDELYLERYAFAKATLQMQNVTTCACVKYGGVLHCSRTSVATERYERGKSRADGWGHCALHFTNSICAKILHGLSAHASIDIYAIMLHDLRGAPVML